MEHEGLCVDQGVYVLTWGYNVIMLSSISGELEGISLLVTLAALRVAICHLVAAPLKYLKDCWMGFM